MVTAVEEVAIAATSKTTQLVWKPPAASDASEDGRMGIKRNAGGGDGDYGKDDTVNLKSENWITNAVVETPVVAIAIASTANTAQ